VFWLNLALVIAIASGLLLLCLSPAERLWPSARVIVRLGFQLSAVLAVTWFLITLDDNSLAASGGFSVPAGSSTTSQLLRTVLAAAGPSFLLIATATVLGSVVGLGVAYSITAFHDRRLVVVGLLATVVLAIPTFLLAVIIQEIQARIYLATGQAVAGGYARVTVLAILWAATVLGLRPAAYVFRQARVALDQGELADYVRAARARGLTWPRIARRYVFRPTTPTLVSGWLNSFRFMIGSLPLVEFFFGYPGVGQQLIFALGIGYQGAQPLQPDLAIALVMTLAVMLLVLEAAANLLQQLLDPRLRELRTEGQ
jgi:peptide/nickel transport system permease protein